MNTRMNLRVRSLRMPGRILAAAAVGTAAAVALAAGPAHAASSSAGKDNFAGQCDAQVHVSDATTYGTVEVFGGFSCPTGTGLWNQPTSTMKLTIIRNGTEILVGHYDIPTCWELWTCSTDSYAITYPDYSSTDSFRGRMQITSYSGSVTLTTGTIRT